MSVFDHKEEVTLTRRVREIMRREWRCVFDPVLLEGMVYEGILGSYTAGRVTLSECRGRYRELGLPTRAEISAAAREAVHSWGED